MSNPRLQQQPKRKRGRPRKEGKQPKKKAKGRGRGRPPLLTLRAKPNLEDIDIEDYPEDLPDPVINYLEEKEEKQDLPSPPPIDIDLPEDVKFKELPDFLTEEEKKFIHLFEALASPESLSAIFNEVKPEEGKQRRNHSNTINNALNEWSKKTEYDISPGFVKTENEMKKITEMLQIKFMHSKDVFEQSLPFIAKLVKTAYTNINTQTNVFMKLRAVLEKRFSDKDFIKFVKNTLTIGRMEHTMLKERYQENVLKRHDKQIPLDEEKAIGIINVLKNSDDWREMTCCVGMAVGSRLSEILRNSNYQEPKSAFENFITIIGVSKDRDKVEDDKGEAKSARTITKPILGGLSAKDIIELVSTIRLHLSKEKGWDMGELPNGKKATGKKKKTVSQMVSAVEQELKSTIKTIWNELGLQRYDFKFHTFRALYAEIATLHFPPSQASREAYYAHLLGHDKKNITTALSYMRFKIARKVEVNVDLPSYVKTLEEQVKTMESELKAAGVFPVKEPDEVKFYGKDGEPFFLRKQPNVHNKKDDERLSRLGAHVEQLEEKGVRPTYRNLQKLGYGTTVIRQYFGMFKKTEEKQSLIDKSNNQEEGGEIVHFDEELAQV
jgi:hypothetical protein